MKLSAAKLFTGMMVPALIAAGAVYPVIAGTVNESEPQSILLSQATQVGELAGEITDISGETVAFAQSDGTTRDITIPQQEITRLNLQIGQKIAVRLNTQGVATSVRVINPVRALW
ncbi:MAG: hypothetical protein F6K36_26215 [Symploca sp. SIO3C6]|nr:hypothetical protein [Symploca sp. SIO3C6]NET05293.1 hypothetical protein [Symploca sp. SIO2B6]NET51180.1 hypothetical protein [Merismopedia sp. SIO2A8]